ncbi:MAG: stage III sporulation protein SpoIIIAB [Desulfotomaculales bacterium]
MLKLLGALLVVGSGGAAGLLVARSYARRPEELRALQGALALLSTEISFALTPLPDALMQVARRADPRVAGLFCETATSLQNRNGETVEEAWAKALDRFAARSALRDEDVAAVAELGAVLGASDCEDQARHLVLVVERLKMQGLRAEEEASKNVRLWRYLGFCAGAAMVLVLC